MSIRIGTSGWAYAHWRGIFYPAALPQREWFAHYARQFDTVEINNTFYRLPLESTFDAWHKQAPGGFLYALKASRYLTHLRKLKDPEEPLRTFFDRANLLGDTLGPVLYQLPPHWHIDLSRLQRFLAALPTGRVHVIEFRDSSWLTEDVFQLLERHAIAHCIHDMHPLRIPVRITAPTAYVRFHGDPTHGGDYPLSALELWARRIDEWEQRGLNVFVYFNNDAGGHALKNASELRSLIHGR